MRRELMDKPGQSDHVNVTTIFESKFNFGDRVYIDGGSVAGIAVGFCFYPHDSQVQVSWWKDGAIVEQWIGAWRLKKETT
jgi:hypothetical protein